MPAPTDRMKQPPVSRVERTMQTGMAVLVAWSVGCGAAPRQGLPPSPPPPPSRVSPAQPAAPSKVLPALSPLEPLAAVLADSRLTLLTLGPAEAACASDRTTWIAAVDGVGCTITDADVRCVGTTATDPFKLERALCDTASTAVTPPPDWTPKVAAFVRQLGPSSWTVEPVPSTPELPALRVSIDGEEHALVRIAGRWRPSIAPGPQRSGRTRIVRALDATALAHQTAVALIVEDYDGGSEQGVHVSFLDVLCDSPDGLRGCGSIQIGSLAWALAAENRENHPGAATSLQNRPHVEVLLTPTVRFPDRLQLSLEISHLTSTLDEELVSPVRALTHHVGDWRLEHGTFVRVK
ncbi:MAG: hypothetical protein JWP01_2593 [Myxococcales bacterium]|nr:hypothetical protein [Myxococcales bacterium]